MDSAIFETALLYNVLRLNRFTKKTISKAVSRTKNGTGKSFNKLGFRYFVRGNTPGQRNR